MFTAYNTAEAARNEIVDTDDKTSPAMRYFGRTEVKLQAELAYGAPVKYLVHPEIRGSKFNDHALPGTYRGPSRENESSHISWVLTDRVKQEYVTVMNGCMRVDERPCIARSTLSHPSHQPHSDQSVEDKRDIEPDALNFDLWRDPTL